MAAENLPTHTAQSKGSKLHLLTPEEHAALKAQGHKLLAALEEGNIVAEAWLASWRNGPRDEAQAQAAEVREMIAPGGQPAPEQGSLMQWCGFPTDMTRVSPFFPMKPNLLGHREFLQDYLITSANWGEIRYTGPKLSTYEEDALMVLLAILEQQSQYKHQTFTYEAATEYDDSTGRYENKTHFVDQEIKGATRKTYTYRGPAWPLLRLLGYDKPGKDAYKRLVRSLKLLTVAGVELAVAARTKTGKRKIRYTTMSSMLSNVAWDEEKKELSATINPFFYETYFAGRVTLLDVQKRVAISGSIAKCLYRFVQSHSPKEPLWTGHFLTLADALNMDREQPAKEIKRALKVAINELIAQGILTKQSRIIREDIVTLFRADGTLPALGAAKKKKLSK